MPTVVAKGFDNDTSISCLFEASVFVDLSVRCYYGTLKYNYNHYVNAKHFYEQLH